jgi:hypothetical protein
MGAVRYNTVISKSRAKRNKWIYSNYQGEIIDNLGIYFLLAHNLKNQRVLYVLDQ